MFGLMVLLILLHVAGAAGTRKSMESRKDFLAWIAHPRGRASLLARILGRDDSYIRDIMRGKSRFTAAEAEQVRILSSLDPSQIPTRGEETDE